MQDIPLDRIEGKQRNKLHSSRGIVGGRAVVSTPDGYSSNRIHPTTFFCKLVCI